MKILPPRLLVYKFSYIVLVYIHTYLTSDQFELFDFWGGEFPCMYDRISSIKHMEIIHTKRYIHGKIACFGDPPSPETMVNTIKSEKSFKKTSKTNCYVEKHVCMFVDFDGFYNAFWLKPPNIHFDVTTF